MNNREEVIDKLGLYINKRISKQKNQQLFGGQFLNRPSHTEKHVSDPFPFSNLNYQTGHKYQTYNLEDEQNEREESNSLYVSGSKHKNSKESSRKDYQDLPVKRKRLKKLRELEENQCSVCLQQIKKRCQLKCKHKFCFECVQNWFETSNRCPLCRAEIHSFWYKGQEFMVETREAELSSEDQQLLDGQCYNCQHTREGDILLVCDRCQNACHIECDRTLRGVLPEGEWFCHFCR